MKWISLVCVLCLLQLASAACECGDGQQSFIPSRITIDPPNQFNGSDGSLSSFSSSCVDQSSLYVCSNNTDNPLFDCGASNNSFYSWDTEELRNPLLFSPTVIFGRYFQSMNISVVFLISTSSNISVPTMIEYNVFQSESSGLIPSGKATLPTNLPEGPYQHNFMLSADRMFKGIVINITPDPSFQWVAIDNMIFCAAAIEDQTVSTSVSSAMSPTTSSSTTSTTMSPTVSTMLSPTASTMSPTASTMSPSVSTMLSPTASTMSPTASTMLPAVSIMSPATSTMSPSMSPTESVTATTDGSDSDDDEDTLPLALLVAVVVIAIFLFLVVLLLAIILCCICRKKSYSDMLTIETAQKPAVVPEGYEMLTADTLPTSVSNGISNGVSKNDYDYPQLPLKMDNHVDKNDNHIDENDNHIDGPYYSAPEVKKTKPITKGSSFTLPATFVRSNIDDALYEMPSIAAASSQASFNKVIEDGEPVYYMLDKKYSFYEEKSKSLNALDEVDLRPYTSIYDDPQPLTKSEAPNYVKPTDIKEIKLLGDGQFGEVYLAEVVGISASAFDGMDPSSASPLQVAIKRLHGNPSEEMLQAFEKEIKFMSRLKHKNVIRLLGICTDADHPFIMIEYAKNGDLNKYLRSMKLTEGSIPPSKREITKLGLLSQCTQIAYGMEYLSSLNFIHRDLATRNVLVGDWNQVKIADFGMSQNLYDSDYYRVKGHAIVPIRWMATECFYGRFSVKSDVWAFGVVVWEVFTMCSQRPYEEMTDAEVIQNARYSDKRKLLKQTEHCPDQVYQLLLQCWKSVPAERPNFTQLHDQFTRLCNGSI